MKNLEQVNPNYDVSGYIQRELSKEEKAAQMNSGLGEHSYRNLQAIGAEVKMNQNKTWWSINDCSMSDS